MLEKEKFLYFIDFLDKKSINKESMQVISSRCTNTARSTSRSRRKGLSLTSRSRFDSQEKQSCTEDTLQTIVVNQGQTQTSIKLEKVNQKITWFNKDSRQTQHSVAVSKKLADMPKITFRYTNETGNSFQKVNLFSGQFSTTTNPLTNRGRPINSHQMRKVIISNSVQTKNLSQSKINNQGLISEANPNKQFIDSRRIDRQIVEEKVIAYLPPLEQKNALVQIDLIQKSPKKQTISVFKDFFNQKIEPPNQYKSRTVEKNLSPYQLLASSAKKNEGKEPSPGIKQHGSLQIISLEKIPQVQQFNINQNQDDGEASFCEKNHSYKEQSQEKVVSVFNQSTNFINKISIEVSECSSPQKQMTGNQIDSISEKVLGQKETNLIEVANKVQKNKNLSNSSSPSKKQKNKKENVVIVQIENRAPQVQQVCSISGKRNLKRIKEIEKRLDQIINICINNL